MYREDVFTLDFHEAKEKYKECRKDERRGIIAAIDEQYFKSDSGDEKRYQVLNRSLGEGGESYGTRKSGALPLPYDLRNWNWITIKDLKNGVRFELFLQAFDIDPVSKNLHVLYDRIALYNPSTYEQVITPFDLPLGENDLKALIKDIDSFADSCNDSTAQNNESRLLKYLHSEMKIVR
jgi:hypothetical protein